jgi:hypothetical protein
MPKLTIAGPNLSSGATFHVHKAGCRDLKSRAKGYGPDVDLDTDDFASVQEICEFVYADHMAENEPGSEFSTWEGYVGEFDIYPCVKGLPTETPAEGQEVSQETPCASDHSDATVVTSSKAPAKRTAKEATKMSTKTETKATKRTWNKTQARKVVSLRNGTKTREAMSWAAIGNELGFSPRTVRAMFDSVNGADAHYDNRLPGKGGRTRTGVNEAKAKLAAATEQD